MKNKERKSQREVRMVEGKEGFTEAKFIERAKSLGFFEILFYGAMIETLHVRIKLVCSHFVNFSRERKNSILER
jgi:hypothetical protein